MAYSTIPKYKIITKCAECGATNCKGRKRQKSYYCLSCIRGNDTNTQVSKAKERDRQMEEKVKGMKPKEKRTLKRSIASSVRSLADSPQNKENLTKSKLLKLCDAAFSRWIKNRDADKNGDIICVCCGRKANILDVDKDGQKIVQPLHYIDRAVYSLRFSEDNVFSGHSICNRNMFLDTKKEKSEFKRYREFLAERLGEEEVALMEIEHRKINRLEESQLKVILEHYGQ